GRPRALGTWHPLGTGHLALGTGSLAPPWHWAPGPWHWEPGPPLALGTWPLALGAWHPLGTGHLALGPGCLERAEAAARFSTVRPPHTLTSQGRSVAAALLLPSAAGWLLRRSVGRTGALTSIPRPDGQSHLVRHCERCESDRVADRPFALHAEAPDRRG